MHDRAGPTVRVYFTSFLARVGPQTGMSWAGFLRRLQHLLTREEFDHVSIASRGVVLDPSVARGDTLYAEITYVKAHSGLSWMIEVPTAQVFTSKRGSSGQTCPKPPPVLDVDPRPKTPVRALARWLTRGRVYSRDCVTRVVGVLSEAGVFVPRHVVTPGQLFDWLRGEGYTQHEL
jgi:hypothetical protein